MTLFSPFRTGAGGTGTLVVEAPARPAPPLRVRYWPGLGVWPLIVSLVLVGPAALWSRREAAFPSTLVCTTAFRVGVGTPGVAPRLVDATCSAHDARDVRTFTQVPCEALVSAFEGLVDLGPWSRPVVDAVESSAGGLPPGAGSLAIDPARGLDVATARRLLEACARAEPLHGAPRTLQILVLDRDYGPTALAITGVLAVVLALGLRRRVRVDVDPGHHLVLVIERGFMRERRTVVIPFEDLEGVDVTTGATGVLSGRRVELVCRGGRRVPLTEGYFPLTYAVHRQAARRVLALVEGARSRPWGA